MSANRNLSCLAIALSLATGCAGDGSEGASPPFSSADAGSNIGFGGAQDIGQFRSILDQGGIPGPETLDANGFFNEHFAELPPADCGNDLCVHGMLSVGTSWTDDATHTDLQLAINTPRSAADIERLPLNLVVVVDTSGSMASDDRLVHAKQGLHRLIDGLEEGDRLAIITYSVSASTRVELSAQVDATALHALVDSLQPGGGTNLFDGLETGLSHLIASYDVGRQNRVILVSDGQATVGNTSTSAIIAMAEQFIADGIGLTTVGVGYDFNVELMRGLAERGAGNFYFIESAQAIEEVFTEEIDYFMSPLALGIRLEVLADGAYELGQVLGTRLWETEGPVGAVYIPAAFLSSRTTNTPGPGGGRRGGGSTLFVSMSPRGAFDDPHKVARVRLSYRLPGTTSRIEQEILVTNPNDPGIVPEGEYYSDEVVVPRYGMVNMYRGLSKAAGLARFDYHCSEATLRTLEQNAIAWNAVHEDVDMVLDLALIAQFRTNLRAQGASADACGGSGGGFDSDAGPWPSDGWGGDDTPGCSAGGSVPGTAAVLVVFLLLGCRWRARGRTSR